MVGAGSRDERSIYHEKQESALCGAHALNSLMQGPYFTVGDLALIAQEMDIREAKVRGVPRSQLGRSNNVDETGNFSIQVLESALNRQAGIALVPLEAGENVTNHEAYLCNRAQHWLSIRKVYGMYWDLNSMIDKPRKVSTTELDTFFKEMRADGYTVHRCGTIADKTKRDAATSSNSKSERKKQDAVKLPAPSVLRGQSNNEDIERRWIPLRDLVSSSELSQAVEVFGGKGQSLKRSNNSNVPAANGDDDIERAIKASLETARENVAKQITLPREPEPGSGVVQVQIRGQGRAIRRRFLATDPCVSVFDFYLVEFRSIEDASLIESDPRTRSRIIHTRESVVGQTVAEAKFAGKSFVASAATPSVK